MTKKSLPIHQLFLSKLKIYLLLLAECKKKIRISAHKSWTFICFMLQLQDTEVRQDKAAGVMINGNDLVLSKVRKTQAGHYYCKATNSEGNGVSPPVNITVRCKYVQLLSVMFTCTVYEYPKGYLPCPPVPVSRPQTPQCAPRPRTCGRSRATR